MSILFSFQQHLFCFNSFSSDHYFLYFLHPSLLRTFVATSDLRTPNFCASFAWEKRHQLFGKMSDWHIDTNSIQKVTKDIFSSIIRWAKQHLFNKL